MDEDNLTLDQVLAILEEEQKITSDLFETDRFEMPFVSDEEY